MSVFRFSNPMAFQLLWLVPIVLLVSFYLAKSQRAKLVKHLGPRLMPFLTSSVSTPRRRWKMILEAAVVLLFVLALARPQSGQSRQKVRSEGIEIMFLVDVSKSMLAEDIKPSRIELAKKELTRLIELGSGDRVGIIAFAGSAVLLSPMTTDTSAIKMYIDSLSPDSVSSQGTEFRRALDEASTAFDRGGLEEDDQTVVTRAVLIASDGEDNEPGALDAAKKLADQGVRIFTLAFGTEKGGAIPLRDRRGNLRGYQKDKDGKVILTQTKGSILKDLAREGQGSFYHATFGGTSINSLRSDIEKLEQAEFANAEVTNYNEQFQFWLLLGIILAIIELVLGERRPAGRIWKGRYEVSES